MTYDVYLSSTLNDLRVERDQIKQALVAANLSFKESYSASETSLIESCIDDVGKCRVYIGVVAGRYGYCPPNEDGSSGTQSITELEFLAAGKSGLPRYVFIKTDLIRHQPQPGSRHELADAYADPCHLAGASHHAHQPHPVPARRVDA